MSDSDLKVIVKAKELAVQTFKLTSNSNRYPKKYRHSLVDKIQNKTLDLYTTLYEANRISNVTHKNKRIEMITQGITYCDEILFFIELSISIGVLGKASAGHWSKMVTDVKHLSLAWRKSEK